MFIFQVSPAFPGGQDRGSPRPSNHPKQARSTIESNDARGIAQEEGQVMAAGHCTVRLTLGTLFLGTFNGSISGKHCKGEVWEISPFFGKPENCGDFLVADGMERLAGVYWTVCGKKCLILKLRVQWLWRWQFLFSRFGWVQPPSHSDFGLSRVRLLRFLVTPLSHTKLLRPLRGLINIPRQKGQLDSLKLTEKTSTQFHQILGVQDVNLWGMYIFYGFSSPCEA